MTRAARDLARERDRKQEMLDRARKKAGRLSIEVAHRRTWNTKDRRVAAMVAETEQELEAAQTEVQTLEAAVSDLAKRITVELDRARRMTPAEKQAELAERLAEELRAAGDVLADLRGDREVVIARGLQAAGLDDLDRRIRDAERDRDRLDSKLAILKGAMLPTATTTKTKRATARA